MGKGALTTKHGVFGCLGTFAVCVVIGSCVCYRFANRPVDSPANTAQDRYRTDVAIINSYALKSKTAKIINYTAVNVGNERVYSFRIEAIIRDKEGLIIPASSGIIEVKLPKPLFPNQSYEGEFEVGSIDLIVWSHELKVLKD